MQADTRGLREAEKFLKENPTISYADFMARGLELAKALYKKDETQKRFLHSWEYESRFHVFCSDRSIGNAIETCLGHINAFQQFAKKQEQPGYYRLDSDRRKQNELRENYDKAWEALQALGLKYEHYYEENGWLFVREVIIAEIFDNVDLSREIRQTVIEKYSVITQPDNASYRAAHDIVRLCRTGVHPIALIRRENKFTPHAFYEDAIHMLIERAQQDKERSK